MPAPPSRPSSRRYIRQRSSHEEDLSETGSGMIVDGGYLTMRGKMYLLVIFVLVANILNTVRTTTVSTPLFDTLSAALPTDALSLYPGFSSVSKALPARGADPFNYGKPGEGGEVTTEEEAPFQPSKYDYRKEPKRTKFNLPDPKLDLNNTNHPDPTILVLVMSARQNYEHRIAIRETWAKDRQNVLFLIGGPLPPEDQTKEQKEDERSLQPLLEKEQETFQDLLDTLHPDTYKGLPYKLHYAFQWLYRQPHNASQHFHWIVKVDDNVVVRIKRLLRLVLKKFNYHHPIVIADVVTLSPVARTGKWAEDPHYEGLNYPPWPRGASGYVVSQPVAQYLGTTKDLYYYQGEDVSLGIWLDQAHNKFGPNGADLTYIHQPHDFTFQDGCFYPHVITGHDLKPEVIRDCWTSQGEDSIPEHKSRIYEQASQIKLHSKTSEEPFVAEGAELMDWGGSGDGQPYGEVPPFE